MVYRLVAGTIYHTNGQPWEGAEIKFVRSPSTYTSTAHFPADSVLLKTNSLGKFEISLWCNEGATHTEYKCFLPDDSFKFALPVGTTPLTIEFLRELGIAPTNPQYPTLKAYVDNAIAGIAGATPPIKLSFNFGNLLGGRFLEIEHNFSSSPFWQLRNNENERVFPDQVLDVSLNKIRFDFLSFIPLPGNWEVILHK